MNIKKPNSPKNILNDNFKTDEPSINLIPEEQWLKMNPVII